MKGEKGEEKGNEYGAKAGEKLKSNEYERDWPSFMWSWSSSRNG